MLHTPFKINKQCTPSFINISHAHFPYNSNKFFRKKLFIFQQKFSNLVQTLSTINKIFIARFLSHAHLPYNSYKLFTIKLFIFRQMSLYLVQTHSRINKIFMPRFSNISHAHLPYNSNKFFRKNFYYSIKCLQI